MRRNRRLAALLSIGFLILSGAALLMDNVLHTAVLGGLAGCWFIASGTFAVRTWRSTTGPVTRS